MSELPKPERTGAPGAPAEGKRCSHISVKRSYAQKLTALYGRRCTMVTPLPRHSARTPSVRITCEVAKQSAGEEEGCAQELGKRYYEVKQTLQLHSMDPKRAGAGTQAGQPTYVKVKTTTASPAALARPGYRELMIIVLHNPLVLGAFR